MLPIIGAMLAGAFVGGLVVHAFWRTYFDGYRAQKEANLRWLVDAIAIRRGRP